MHLAYRWFTRLGLSKRSLTTRRSPKTGTDDFGNRVVFREVFEEIVRRCLQAGLVEGRNLAWMELWCKPTPASRAACRENNCVEAAQGLANGSGIPDGTGAAEPRGRSRMSARWHRRRYRSPIRMRLGPSRVDRRRWPIYDNLSDRHSQSSDPYAWKPRRRRFRQETIAARRNAVTGGEAGTPPR